MYFTEIIISQNTADIKTDDAYKDITEDIETRLKLQIINEIDHYLKREIKK